MVLYEIKTQLSNNTKNVNKYCYKTVSKYKSRLTQSGNFIIPKEREGIYF